MMWASRNVGQNVFDAPREGLAAQISPRGRAGPDLSYASSGGPNMKRPFFQIMILCLGLMALFISRAAIPRAQGGASYSAPRLDAWRILGPGGGGAQFYPAVSPHDPNLVLVACDMTGAYISENGGQSWRLFNLRSPVTFFAFDPQDPKVIYAGADALWRSEDRGHTWGLVYPSSSDVRLIMPDDHATPVYLAHQEPVGRVLALAVDPDDSRKLYATIREKDGVELYFSSDRGAQWRRVTERELRGGGRKILIDPHSPAADRTLYILGDDSVTVRKGGQFMPRQPPEGVRQVAD